MTKREGEMKKKKKKKKKTKRSTTSTMGMRPAHDEPRAHESMHTSLLHKAMSCVCGSKARVCGWTAPKPKADPWADLGQEVAWPSERAT